MADIFLSYASEDRERVRPLVERLEEHGWSVWWDREIPKGKEWSDVLEEAIEISRTMVVVWTEVSVASSWVRVEAREGKARPGGLIPVRLDEVKIRLEFKGLQDADLTDWDGSVSHPELQATFSALEAILGVPLAAQEAGAKRKQAEEKAAETERKQEADAASDAKRMQGKEAAAEAAPEAERRHQVDEADARRKQKEEEAAEANRNQEVSFVRRMLLLYTPVSSRGGGYHTAFYILVLASVAVILIDLFNPETVANDFGYLLLGMLVIPGPIAAILVRGANRDLKRHLDEQRATGD